MCCPRDFVSRHMGAPAVPPLCQETQSLGQQMLNAQVGINGLTFQNVNNEDITVLEANIILALPNGEGEGGRLLSLTSERSALLLYARADKPPNHLTCARSSFLSSFCALLLFYFTFYALLFYFTFFSSFFMKRFLFLFFFCTQEKYLLKISR